MATLEAQVLTRTRKGALRSAVLGSLAAGGILVATLAAPNAIRLLKHLDPLWEAKRDPKRRLKEIGYTLRRKGLVEFVPHRGGTRMVLTEKGRRELRRLTLLAGPQAAPRRWDGRWRMVIFDIPEKKRKIRVRARMLMRQFGFERLQDSVWVYPFDCEELVALLKSELRIGSDMLYVIADAIEHDARLRSHFGLPAER